MNISFNMDGTQGMTLGGSEPVSEFNLATLPVGESAQITSVGEPGSAGERLMEMGLTPGTMIRVIRKGWWGDPIHIEVRGYTLTVSRVQGRQIGVRRL